MQHAIFHQCLTKQLVGIFWVLPAPNLRTLLASNLVPSTPSQKAAKRSKYRTGHGGSAMMRVSRMHASRSLPPAGPGLHLFFLPACLAQRVLFGPLSASASENPRTCRDKDRGGNKGGRRAAKIRTLAVKGRCRACMRPGRSGAIQCASFMAKVQYPVFLLQSATPLSLLLSAYLLSHLYIRRMPSNDSTWFRMLHITGCIQISSLHASRCSVPCACTCTCNALPLGAAGHSIHMLQQRYPGITISYCTRQ